MTRAEKPIGLFDSGIGGLTVARAIRARLPAERLVYLGDTARLPYGTKSADTVTRYAVQAAQALLRYDVKAVVIACNTASAVALPTLEAALAPTPVLGVIGPGAQAAVAATRRNHIAVLATEGTVRGGAYHQAIKALSPDAIVEQKACPLLVSLAEEGWLDDDVAALTARRYVGPLFAREAARRPDTLVLGCTHFPALREVIGAAAGRGVTLVDSAETTAAELDRTLARLGLKRMGEPEAPHFLSTDAPERFVRIGGLFLGEPVPQSQVSLVDLSG